MLSPALLRQRCACVDVDFGTYANSIALWPPPELGITRIPVTVDRCIAAEVVELWSAGVVTSGNCCGHNKGSAFISTADVASTARMLGMGYTPHPDRPDHFYPLSLKVAAKARP